DREQLAREREGVARVLPGELEPRRAGADDAAAPRGLERAQERVERARASVRPLGEEQRLDPSWRGRRGLAPGGAGARRPGGRWRSGRELARHDRARELARLARRRGPELAREELLERRELAQRARRLAGEGERAHEVSPRALVQGIGGDRAPREV